MAQAAVKLQTLVGSAETEAFNASLDAIRAKHSSLGFLKVDAKAATKEVAEAARASAWCMVDVLVTLDPSNRQAEGDRMAAEIAAARGIEGDSVRPYRQRGRAVATNLATIREADRSKADPLTLAKKIMAKAADTAARMATIAAHDQAAREIAAGALQMTPEVFQAALVSGLDGAAVAYFEAVQLCKRRAEVVATIAEALDVLKGADSETVARVKAMVAAI